MPAGEWTETIERYNTEVAKLGQLGRLVMRDRPTRAFCAYKHACGTPGARPPEWPTATTGERCVAFRCARCRDLVGWCKGGGLEHPDWCDDCVNEAAGEA